MLIDLISSEKKEAFFRSKEKKKKKKENGTIRRMGGKCGKLCLFCLDGDRKLKIVKFVIFYIYLFINILCSLL